MARGSVFNAAIIMLVLSVLLFWIPVIGPLAAGFVGGRRAGSPGSAAVAALVPALVAGILVGVLVNLLPGIAPWLATLFATAFTIWLVLQMGLVIAGALIGGWVVERGPSAGTPTVR